ncbi:hypothetical protein [Celeribacter naphthalenivorans]|uniref:hypothetical protein n=1 Tax=Celeribacter naphthalenivorans TaxID=1614694 RepID=UPI001CFBFCC1|nr:hypothetical protein [Celeribacter naphthalenivorans]
MAQNESYNQSSGNGGLYFILGAVVVVLGVILYVVMGGDTTPMTETGDSASVTINNDAPDNGGSASVTTEEPAAEAPASE